MGRTLFIGMVIVHIHVYNVFRKVAHHCGCKVLLIGEDAHHCGVKFLFFSEVAHHCGSDFRLFSMVDKGLYMVTLTCMQFQVVCSGLIGFDTVFFTLFCCLPTLRPGVILHRFGQGTDSSQPQPVLGHFGQPVPFLQ